MKKFFILSLLVLFTVCAFAQQPLYRYYNAKQKKHYFTIHFNEYGNGTRDFAYEGVSCRVFNAGNPEAGIRPMFRYYNPKTADHFYTMVLHELGPGDNGYTFEGPAYFLYKLHAPGSVPLLRYYNPVTTDHFYTTDKMELGPGFEGYNYEGVAGYVLRK